MILKSRFLKRNHSFLIVAILIFLWRLLFEWRGLISTPLSAEVGWIEDAKNYSFRKNLTIPDAGYPVPLLRSALWLVVHLTKNHAGIALHFLSLVIVCVSCGAVLFIKNTNIPRINLGLIALILGAFPPPDLLLWHNLSYFTFIPLIIVILNMQDAPDESIKWYVSATGILILFTTKPQLLMAAGTLLISLLLLTKERGLQKLISYSAVLGIIAILIVLGRSDNSQIALYVGMHQILYFLTSPFILPAAILFPVITMGFSAYSYSIGNKELWNISQGTITIISALTTYLMFRTVIKVKKLDLNQKLLLATIVPLILSFYTFCNSGLALKFYWQDISTIPLYSRHWLPFLFLSLLFISSFWSKISIFKLKHLLGFLFCQLGILGVLGYGTYYSPIFTK